MWLLKLTHLWNIDLLLYIQNPGKDPNFEWKFKDTQLNLAAKSVSIYWHCNNLKVRFSKAKSLYFKVLNKENISIEFVLLKERLLYTSHLIMYKYEV